jgi:hypothetical protein
LDYFVMNHRWRERKKRKPNAKDQTAGAYPDRQA